MIFRVTFYYCQITPRNRKNFAIDRSEFAFRYLINSEISKSFKLQREDGSLKLKTFGFKF